MLFILSRWAPKATCSAYLYNLLCTLYSHLRFVQDFYTFIHIHVLFRIFTHLFTFMFYSHSRFVQDFYTFIHIHVLFMMFAHFLTFPFLHVLIHLLVRGPFKKVFKINSTNKRRFIMQTYRFVRGGGGWGVQIILFFSLLFGTPAPSSERQHPEAWPASTYGYLR